MKDSIFFKQTRLLLRVLPTINEHKVFALKGGTAINFFVRNLPRLSVDIDLTYLDVKPRSESLEDITEKLDQICDTIDKQISGIRFHKKYLSGTKFISGIIINHSGTSIKIEPNTIIRGSVNKPQLKNICRNAEILFELTMKVQCLSNNDLYGGKICAALDRQHPRDLYDIKLLIENEGIEEDLIEVRNKLITTIKELLSEEQKYFLLSFKNKKPEWELSGIQNIGKFPSVKWKLLNLEKMSSQRHRRAYDKLKEYLLS